MTLIRFGAADLPSLQWICLNLRPQDADECFAFVGHKNPFRLANECSGSTDLSWIGTIEGEPVSYLGLTPIDETTWQAASFGTERWPEIVKPLTRFIRRYVMPMMLAGPGDIVQADSLITHIEAHRWMDGLGARPERHLRINQRNFIRFVWRR